MRSETKTGSRDIRSEVVGSGWLVDAVTLEHFASAGRLSHLCLFLQGSDEPYWTEGVRGEVLAGYDASEACREVLNCRELGSPAVIPDELAPKVVRAQIRLGGGGVVGEDHLGEAESFVLADTLGSGVITDDNSAFDFVEKRLGSARAHDTVEVLRALVRAGAIDTGEAKLVADAIRNNDRHLRRNHPPTLTVDYFKLD